MPELVINGKTFPCREYLPDFRMYELSAAMKSSQPMDQMAGMYNFVMAMIKPEHRDDFLSTMRGLDDEGPGSAIKFNQAIGALMEQYAPGRPTERPSRLPTGGEKTPPTRRVVSLSRGTVKEEETLPKDGQSTAS